MWGSTPRKRFDLNCLQLSHPQVPTVEIDTML